MPRSTLSKHKRKFCGDQCTTNFPKKKLLSFNEYAASSSFKRISTIFKPSTDIPSDEYNIVINFAIFKDIISDVGKCPECGSKLILENI